VVFIVAALAEGEPADGIASLAEEEVLDQPNAKKATDRGRQSVLVKEKTTTPKARKSDPHDDGGRRQAKQDCPSK
jgi:hypothetical protein